MIILTTSRDPSQRTREFINELMKCVPGSTKLNRGKVPLRAILRRSPSDVVIQVIERKGNPAELRAYRSGELEISVVLKGIKLLREMHAVQRRSISSLVLSGNGWIAEALGQILNVQMYPAADPGELRGISDAIAFIAHVSEGWRLEFLDGIDLGPCGPTINIASIKEVII